MNNDSNNLNLRHRTPWLTIIFAILALLALILSTREPGVGGWYGTIRSMINPILSPSAPGSAVMQEKGQGIGGFSDYQSPTIMPPIYNGNVPVTDTREFNKMNYNATLRTRNVQELTRRVETTTRGYGGRVDSSSISQKYGYVSFVVSVSKFEQFRNEIEGFVDSRFLSVNINSQNLLPQKQNIEEQQKNAESRLADLKASRKNLVADHTATAHSIQVEIDANAKELSDLNAEVTTDPSRLQYIANRKLELASQRSSLNARLSNENSTYAARIRSLDEEIEYAEKTITAIKTQDKNLLDDVATVNGAIFLSWISFWDALQLYIPGSWIATILGLAAVVSFWWQRRRENSSS